MKLLLASGLVVLASCTSSPGLLGDDPVRIGPVLVASVPGGSEGAPPPGDPAWRPLEEGVSLQRPGLHWLRADVDLPAAAAPGHPFGIAVSALASYELSWDGVAIGQSGRVGTSNRDELPGPVDNVFAVPAATVGPHVATMRLSNFHYDGRLSNSFYGLHVGDYGDLATRGVRARFAPLLALGWVVIAAVLLAFVYFAQGRRPASLVFGVICVFVAAALLGQSWRWILGYSYDHHVTRLWLVTAASALAAGLLPIAFALELGGRTRPAVVASIAIVVAGLTVPDGYNAKAAYLFAGASALALTIAVAAAWRRRRGAWPSIAGLVLCLVPLAAAPHRYHDAGFFAGFSALLVALLGVVATRIRDERRATARATLRSARLELELVKRAIQPHFLMNVLTSILEWIEQEPARAAKFVEALADELRLLSEVSRERSIPVDLELELCRAHVALMSQRLERDIVLRSEGFAIDDQVPPAIFHTLIENALTHGRFAGGPIELALDATRAGRTRVYRLTSPEAAPLPARREGGGLGYVRARLQECYGDRARLRGGAAAAGWVTTIEVDDA